MFIPPQTIQLLDKLAIDDIRGILSQLLTLKEYLLRANRRINLISRQRSALVFDTLTYDSLAILQFYGYRHSATLIDVGSGGGFPWVIHKLIHPKLRVISVDSNSRKIEFQQSLARLLGFQDCDFHAERAEGIGSLGGDYLTAKAFGRIAVILELAVRHLSDNGLLIMPRSGYETEPEQAELKHGSHFVLWRRDSYTNPLAAVAHRSRQLLIYKKVEI